MAKEAKKEKKKVVKKTKEQKVKKEGFFKGLKSEFRKVRWPNKKEMIKYSIATIVFILFFGLFFTLFEVAAAGLKQLIG